MTKAARGIIAVDKMGTKVLFLNPVTYETEVVLDGFEKTVHELLVIPEDNRAQAVQQFYRDNFWNQWFEQVASDGTVSVPPGQRSIPVTSDTRPDGGLPTDISTSRACGKAA